MSLVASVRYQWCSECAGEAPHAMSAGHTLQAHEGNAERQLAHMQDTWQVAEAALLMTRAERQEREVEEEQLAMRREALVEGLMRRCVQQEEAMARLREEAICEQQLLAAQAGLEEALQEERTEARDVLQAAKEQDNVSVDALGEQLRACLVVAVLVFRSADHTWHHAVV